MAALTGLLALGVASSSPAQLTALCLGKPATIVGTDGDDVIRGTDRRDVIAGLGGNDTIDGLGGADTICGGDGNDVISTGSEGEDRVRDALSGDGGDDVLRAEHYGALPVVSFKEAPGPVVVDLVARRSTGWGDDRLDGRFGVEGSAYSDSITGDDSFNFLSGGPGDDRIVAGDGQDSLDGGPGDDLLDGGKARRRTPSDETTDFATYSEAPRGIAANLASGRVTGWGSDRLVGIEGIEGSRYADRLVGGPRSETFYGLAGDDVLRCKGGNDWVWSGAGDDLVVGGDGHDRLRGEGAGRIDTGVRKVPPGNDRLSGGRGNDDLAGEDGRDSLEGGPGADQLGEFDSGNDTIDGGPGADWADFRFAPRRVVASLASGRALGWGQDRLVSIERLIGSRFSDRLFGSPGSDMIYGRSGADLIVGASGNDFLFGEDGSDRLEGGSGRDALDGGASRDWLEGGSGRDLCTTGERHRRDCEGVQRPQEEG